MMLTDSSQAFRALCDRTANVMLAVMATTYIFTVRLLSSLSLFLPPPHPSSLPFQTHSVRPQQHPHCPHQPILLPKHKHTAPDSDKKHALTPSYPRRPPSSDNRLRRHLHHLPKRQPGRHLLRCRTIQRHLPLNHTLRPHDRGLRPRRH